jgi:hypothetical protein
MPIVNTKNAEARAIEAIADKVEHLDLAQLPAWSNLDELSNRTTLDGIEVDPAGITISGQDFKGVANVYVVLDYRGRPGEEGFTTSDSFLAEFSGRIESGEPIIDTFAVDTSPFFEGEDG